MTLDHRAVLITGTRRIGAVVAVELAARGASVALGFNKSAREAESAASLVRSRGGRAEVIQADVSQEADCRRVVERTVELFGQIDVLVNMASLYTARPFDQTTAEDFNRQIAVDLRGAFLTAMAAIPHMRRQGGGRIVNLTDWLAASGRPRYDGYLPYYVAKAGVVALTEALALEVAADGILVNAIAPGPILPPAGRPAEEGEAAVRATPLGRWGGAEEIAKAVISLIETDFITGETIRVDGGRHLR